MAYQPKSYKKFVATAATATLVASAIVPVALANEATVAFTDVSAIYKDAVDYLVSENLSNGLTETEFGINANIKRGDAAIILAKALGIQDDAEAADSGFSDVPTRASLAINSLKAAGVIKGKTATRFGFEDNLTRGEVALILANVKAYNYAGDVSKLKFTDVIGTRYASAVAGMVEAGITQGKTATSFGTGDAIKRGDFAIFIYKAEGSPALKANVDTLEINAEGNEFTLMFNRMIPADADIKWLADNYSITINGDAATEAQLTALKLEVKSLSADGKTLVVTHTDLDELGLEGESVELSIGGAKATYTFEVSTDAELESVTAINAKTLEVQFDQELTTEEIAALTYEVTVNGSVSSFKVDKYNLDSATLVRSTGGTLEVGEYVVTVKGLAEEKSVTTTVAAQKATTLDATTTKLLDETTLAPVGVSLKDQYGVDLAFTGSDFVVTGFNVTQNKSVSVNYDATNKTFFVNTVDFDKTDNLDNFKAGDKVRVTFLHKTSSLQATTELDVVAGAQLSSIAFGDLELPTGKDKVTVGLEGVKVPYVAKDQYGDAATLDISGSDANVTVVSSDDTIVNPADLTLVTENKVTKVQLPKFTKAGVATLTFVNKVTGEVSRFTVDVKEAAGVVTNIEIVPNSVTIAEDGIAYVDVNVTDNYGTKLAPKDYVGGLYTLSNSNSSVIAGQGFVTDAADKNYGKLAIGLNSAATKGQSALVSLTVNKTGNTDSVNVLVGEAALPSALQLDAKDTHASTLIVNGTTTVKYSVFDQYANTVEGNTAYQVKYEIAGTNKDAITLSETSETAGVLETAAVNVTAVKSGSATLVAKLMKGEEVISSITVPFTVSANSAGAFTYEVDAIAPLFKDGDGTTLAGEPLVEVENEVLDPEETGTNTYAQEVNVSAKNADGKLLSLPNSSILGVTAATSNVSVAKVDGQWYVAGSDRTITADAKGKILINISTDEGTKTIEKEVTILAADAKVSEVVAMDAPVAGIDTAEAVDQLTVPTYEGAINFNTTTNPATAPTDAFLWTVDQFGVAANYNVADADVVSASGFNGITFSTDDTFTKSSNTITVADVNNDTIATANSSYRLTIIESGVALDLPVKIEAALADTFAPTATLASSTGPTNNATTLVATFNEALYNGTTAIANGADVKALFAYSGTALNYTSATYNATAKTVTFVFTTAEDAATLTAANTVKDATGNVSTDEYTYATTETIWTAQQN